MSYFTAIQYVTSFLGLIAFLAALATLILRERTKSSERVVSRARAEDLPEIVRNLLDRLQVPLLEVPESERATIALEMLRLRSKRFGRLTVAAIAVAVIAAVTYLMSAPVQAQTQTEKGTVVATKEKIVALRGDFEALARYPNHRSQVNTDAVRLSRVMLAIPDEPLDQGSRVLKYQYGSYALTLAAATSISDGVRRQLAQDAIAKAELAEGLYSSLLQMSRNGNREALVVYEWLVGDNGINRTRYLRAWATAIEAKALGSSTVADAIDKLRTIECSYLEKFPPSAESELRWAIEQTGVSPAPCVG